MASTLTSRRTFLQTMLVGGTVVIAGVGLGDSARADANDVAGWPAKPFSRHHLKSAIMDTIGTANVPISSKIRLRAPTIAQNGGSVPITVAVDYPMTPQDYIQTVYLFVDHNPFPLAGEFHFTPASGQAYFQSRIKMKKTDHVRVIAKTNHGVLMASKPKVVKVTIGGCGG